MGRRFERWLGRPSTLHFLRQLIGSEDACYANGFSGGCCGCRRVATATAEAQDERERDDGRRARHRQARLKPSNAFTLQQNIGPDLDRESGNTPQVEAKHVEQPPTKSVQELLGSSLREYGMHMSFRAGVPLVDQQVHYDEATKELGRQADVGSMRKLGKLLVDQPEHRHNFDLWLELLQFRQRLDGSKGVLDVWYGMRKRGVDIPIERANAGAFWSVIIQAILDQEEISRGPWLETLISQAHLVRERTGKYYAGLYKEIVGFHWRNGLASNANLWHSNLEKAAMVPADALKQVVIDFVHGRHEGWGRRTFKQHYRGRKERNLYDSCIKACLDLGQPGDAQFWHSWLLGQGDYPSEHMFQTADVQRLFSLDNNKSLPVKHSLRSRNLDSRTKEVSEQHTFTRAGMSTLVGDVHGIKAREISDSFVAKMFATKAFSLDIVIRGLNFFSVDQIGPVALREMALRAETLVKFSGKLLLLQQMNVRVSSSMYCRIMQKLADDGQSELFTALLASDQHPEAYDDMKTQEALLVDFLREGDWAQAHITLLGLTLAGGSSHYKASNRILQHHIYTRQWHSVENLMQTIQIQKAPLSSTTISYLLRLALPERRVRRRPVERQRQDSPTFDALDFVTRALVYAEQVQPSSIRPTAWVELLKRHGMAFRWQSLEKLVLWLAGRYRLTRDSMRNSLQSEVVKSMSPRYRWAVRRRRVLALQRNRPFYLIFDVNRQHAIFAWAFRDAGIRGLMQFNHDQQEHGAQHEHPLSSDALAFTNPTPASKPVEPWARGLDLLRRLQMHYGIPVDKSHLRQVITTRLWIMFGPAYSNLRINEAIRQNNEVPLGRYIQHINEVWSTPEPLFGDIEADLINSAATGRDPKADAELVIHLFGSQNGGLRKTGEYKHVQEYVNVPKWAESIAASPTGLGTGGTNSGKVTAYQRQRAWQRGPFRVVRQKLRPSPYAPGGEKWNSDLERKKWKGARVPVGSRTKYLDVTSVPARAQKLGQGASSTSEARSKTDARENAHHANVDAVEDPKVSKMERLGNTMERQGEAQREKQQEQSEQQEDDVVQYLPLGIALRSDWYQKKK